MKNWIERTNAIGIRPKAGRYGGTYAHRDIAYHFGMWISPKFQLLLVKEYQRLKSEEQRSLGWSAKRELSKINYRIHTDAIKHNLIPEEITKAQASLVYANEADVLNVAMFGMTANRLCAFVEGRRRFAPPGGLNPAAPCALRAYVERRASRVRRRAPQEYVKDVKWCGGFFYCSMIVLDCLALREMLLMLRKCEKNDVYLQIETAVAETAVVILK